MDSLWSRENFSWCRNWNRCKYNVSQSFGVGTTGGEYKHTISIDEMPSHNHNYYMDVFGQTGVGARMGSSLVSSTPNIVPGFVPSGGWITGERSGTFIITDTGGFQSHNNIQPYIAVYMWKRTA